MFVFAVFAVNHLSCEPPVNWSYDDDDDAQRVVTVKVEMVEVVATLLSAN